jgi:endonuclease-3
VGHDFVVLGQVATRSYWSGFCTREVQPIPLSVIVMSAKKSQLEKRPFDIQRAIHRLREAVGLLPKAAMFQLAVEGYQSVFELLVGCIISIRTRDETTLPVSRRLFATARTPAEMSQLSAKEIDALIRESTFHKPKAKQIRAIAMRAVNDYGGELPCDFEVLRSLHGVGPKCANLVLGIACEYSAISVDIHVHRVTNRWGYVQAKTPEKTMAALEKRLPHEFWIELNALLVPFGKHICTGEWPKCSTCPLLDMCQQVGVTRHR